MKQSTLQDHKSNGSHCPTCDELFDSDYGVAAHHWQAHGEKLGEKEFTCNNCGTTFTRPRTEDYNHNFCDDDCMYEYQSGENHPNYNSVKEPCQYCGEICERNESHVGELGPFCDHDCYGSWLSENWSGEDSPSWRGGRRLSDKLRKIMGPGSWKLQSEEYRQSVNRRCEGCGVHEDELDKKLDVHHIVPITSGGVNGGWNYLALCDTCHKTAEWYTHDMYGFEPVLVE